jgi:hypothetical protein
VHGLLEAHQFSQVLIAAVELGVPSALRSGRRPLPDLAAAIGADPARLDRFLRALRALGIVDTDEQLGWGLTAAGQALAGACPSAEGPEPAVGAEYGLDAYARYLRAELFDRWRSPT